MSRLHQLFDYQKFENNPRLASMIQATESRYLKKGSRRELDEDDLFLVNAAGNTDQLALQEELKKNPPSGIIE